MSFPTVESVTTTNFDTAVSSAPINLPSTINSGDLLLLFYTFEQNDSVVDITGPSGWHEFHYGKSGAQRTGIYGKKAVGTEGGGTATLTLTDSSAGTGQVYRITGWDNSGNVEDGVEISQTHNGDTSTYNCPSLTVSWGSADTLWLIYVGCTDDNGGITTLPTTPSPGFSDLVSPSAGGAPANNRNRTNTARMELAAATVDPNSGSLSTGDLTRAATIGIKPVAGGTYEQVSFRFRNDDGDLGAPS